MTFAILTLSAAPVRLAAQQPAATASEQPAGTAVNTPPAEKLSQEEQNKAFLTGGPMVKWTARTLNTSVETAATIFQLVNFLVIVLLIAVPLARVFPKIFRKRSITLGQNLQTARQATEEANARLRAVEEKLAGLDGEIKKLQAQVEQESLEDEKRVKASLVEESARIVESAEQELGVGGLEARQLVPCKIVDGERVIRRKQWCCDCQRGEGKEKHSPDLAGKAPEPQRLMLTHCGCEDRASHRRCRPRD